MCGIAGVINTPWSSDRLKTVAEAMLDSIRHRGPDDRGVYIQNNSALGMQRLSIIDLQTGHQPIFNEDRSLMIIFNGEIYNYLQLREYLVKKGHRFTTRSDTEVVLHLYEEFGPECLHRLNGMFAFAVFNLHNQSVFIARDRFGIKPLYYMQHKKMLAFASELKALRTLPDVQFRLNPEALDLYLTMEYVPAPLSIFSDVFKLEPGCYLVSDNEGVKITRYYHIAFQPKHESEDENFYIEKLDNLLQKSVQRRKISDVPLGAFLSGGIDSSLITHYLKKCSNSDVHTFSIGFDVISFDESPYADAAAEKLGTLHHLHVFSSREMGEIMPGLFDRMDEPFADASILPTWLLSRFTRENVTVALSGDGADELFAGYPTYFARKIADRLPRLSHGILNGISRFLPVSDDNISFDFKVKKFVEGLPYSSDLRNQIWLGSFTPFQKAALYHPGFSNLINPSVSVERIVTEHMKNCDTDPGWERSLWMDMRFYLQDNMLVKVDRASMLNSLEVRVPFLDHELAEFACRMPSRLKYRGTVSKFILKKLAGKYLPDTIVRRPKKGFGIPVAKWIKGPFRDSFRHYLLDSRTEADDMFQFKTVEKLLSDHCSNRKDNRKLLWTLFVFNNWLERNPCTF